MPVQEMLHWSKSLSAKCCTSYTGEDKFQLNMKLLWHSAPCPPRRVYLNIPLEHICCYNDYPKAIGLLHGASQLLLPSVTQRPLSTWAFSWRDARVTSLGPQGYSSFLYPYRRTLQATCISNGDPKSHLSTAATNRSCSDTDMEAFRIPWALSFHTPWALHF